MWFPLIDPDKDLSGLSSRLGKISAAPVRGWEVIDVKGINVNRLLGPRTASRAVAILETRKL